VFALAAPLLALLIVHGFAAPAPQIATPAAAVAAR
jgi:hypothetical protein